jgi:Amt family ammonium transporter
MNVRKILIPTPLLLGGALPVLAAGPDMVNPVAADIGWLVLAAFLAFLLQPGFAMLESGLARTKNAADIMVRIFMNLSLSTLCFWGLGFSLLFGRDIAGILGIPDPGAAAYILGYSGSFDSLSYMLFQVMLCAAVAAIVFGAMAERTKFSVFCLCSILMGAIIYPIAGHWIWGDGGWLASLGFHDFAGGAAIHCVGGMAAFIGCRMVGPRIGKYNLDGTANAVRGHNLALSINGMFLLWLGWFGVACGSFIARPGGESIGLILFNMNLAVAASIVMTLITTWIRYGKPDTSMILNGGIAGIAAVSAGCDLLSPVGACVVGIISGVLVVFAIEFVDKKLHTDDPTGAVSTHGICGAAGCILTGFLSQAGGILYTGKTSLLLVQLGGTVSLLFYTAILSAVMFYVISRMTGLRVSQDEEIAGLDFWEHGLAGVYESSAPVLDPLGDKGSAGNAIPTLQGMKLGWQPEQAPVSPAEAVPVTHLPSRSDNRQGPKMTQIAIITSELRFEALKEALEKIGITGMTVTRVLGFGLQKGHSDVYRGARVKSRLLPKVKVELVVSAIPTKTIVDVAKRILYTGRYGDGKVFVYDVENVIKIRTGEEGYDALQDYPT